MRKERPHPGAQLRFTDVDGLRLTAFVTNTGRGQLPDLELRHRRRARCEDRIKAGKDSGMRNLPFKSFAANRIWLALVALALDLTAWMQMLALTDHDARRWEPKTLRLHLFSLPGRIGTQVAEVVRVRGPRVDAEVLDILRRAGLDDPEQRVHRYPHELSGGQRQRVLIAIALAGEPDLIIADEPTSALDVTVQARILDHLESLVRGTGTALLIITHDLAVAADRADRVVVMRRGRIVESGSPTAILVDSENAYTRRLIAAAPALAHGGIVEPRLHLPPDQVDPPEPIIELDSVTKHFRSRRGGRVVALDDVSLRVAPGRTHAVVGESGSGKSTALRIAMGLAKPTAGTVGFDGIDITSMSWRRVRPLRQRFQLVHQNPFTALDPRFTVRDSIIEPLVSFRIGDRAQRRARAAELLDQVALPRTFLDRRPAELSGGQRQRVAIALALALRPDVVLLDEPVSALDVSVQDQILDLLTDLQQRLGLAYLFVTHDLAVVARIAHTVSVFDRGRVVESGAAAAIFRDPSSEYTRRLLAAIPGRRARTDRIERDIP